VFRLIFDHTHHFLALLDPDGTVLEVNRSVLEVGGLSRVVRGGRGWYEAG
jgi:PAS domain S-box-containing protein